jgi:hypothetical protein
MGSGADIRGRTLGKSRRKCGTLSGGSILAGGSPPAFGPRGCPAAGQPSVQGHHDPPVQIPSYAIAGASHTLATLQSVTTLPT